MGKKKHWYVDLLKSGLKFAVSPAVTSVFFDHGNNLAMTPTGIDELALYHKQCLGWTARFTSIARQINTLRRIVADLWQESPREYEIYRNGSSREFVKISAPTNLWRR